MSERQTYSSIPNKFLRGLHKQSVNLQMLGSDVHHRGMGDLLFIVDEGATSKVSSMIQFQQT